MRKTWYGVLMAVGTAMVALSVATVTAQDPGQGRGPGGPGRGGPRGMPVMMVFDENCNGVVDADEIARAPQLLLKLDRNGDGRLTPDELRPPRPENGSAPPPPPPCAPGARQ